MQVSGSSAMDFSDTGISRTVLHSPPAVFYKAAYCLGLIENCLYQNYSALRESRKD